MRYINSCSDKTPPIDEKPIILNYPIYFSNHSRRWDNKGVTFLNAQQKENPMGKDISSQRNNLMKLIYWRDQPGTTR